MSASKPNYIKTARRKAEKVYPVAMLPCGITPDMPHKLFKVADSGDWREATREEVIEAGLALTCRSLQDMPVMGAPSAVRAFLTLRMRDLECEVFAAMLLDNRHRLIEYKELFRGTVDGASVHPREVVREVFTVPACAAVIFAHNHPSGVAEPSSTDELITRRLRDALALIEVRVLDHLIVGGQHCMSFAERGLL